MKKTIQNQITLILLISIMLVTAIGFMSLYYFGQISRDIEQVVKKDIAVERSAEKIKGQILALRRLERIYFDALQNNQEPVDILSSLTELEETLRAHIEISVLPENVAQLTRLMNLRDQFQKKLEETGSSYLVKDLVQARLGEQQLTAVTDEMLTVIDKVVATRYEQLQLHQKKIEILIANAHRNMIFLLIVCIGGGFFLAYLAPRRVTAPLRKYMAAINQVEELKFDTRLPITGSDEVAQLGRSVNRLIDRFQTFEEMKIKRIRFEKNKQRVLANMLDSGVMMLAIEGEILFINAQLAKILDLGSESYQSKNYQVVDLPEELKDMISEVLTKKERVDSRMMVLHYPDKSGREKKGVEVLTDAGLVRNYQGDVVNVIMTFEDITNPPGKSVFKRISLVDQELF